MPSKFHLCHKTFSDGLTRSILRVGEQKGRIAISFETFGDKPKTKFNISMLIGVSKNLYIIKIIWKYIISIIPLR